MSKASTLVKVAATGKWESGVKTAIGIRNFPKFVMDEPIELGGEDTGPNPMEFVIAALNGCKSVMISLIAKEMNFNFSGMEFDATGIIDTQGLMGVAGVSPHFQGIRFVVNIRTNESEERIQQLKTEVERRCPVFNLFVDAGIKMDSRWNKVDLI